LRCRYCDTAHAFYDGEEIEIGKIIESVKEKSCNLVEITGGEPLVQENVYILMDKLVNLNFKVLLETNGSIDLEKVNKDVIKIMDIKLPSSGEEEKNLYTNFKYLRESDEIKFLMNDKKDYDFAKRIIKKYDLENKMHISFSCVYKILDPKELISWMKEDNMRVRLNLQLHKYIWGPNERGV
jgi:7-carboxy-7-deazaguanine synthase